MPNYILIDGSYFVFYRYHAILNWFRLSHKDQDISTAEHTAEQHPDFINKFKKTFISSIQEIPKKLNIDDFVFIVGKDCKRNNIWRTKLFPKYKDHRVNENQPGISEFFRIAYDELYEMAGVSRIIKHPQLEADDCIALAVKKLQEVDNDNKIWVITSDMDYLQLSSPNVNLINLKFKKLTDSKTSFNNPKKDLFCKIVTGDKSDGIKGIFKKCGIKTAAKYYENPKLFKEKLETENAYEQFLFNKKIIDFNEIPENLTTEFLKDFTINTKT